MKIQDLETKQTNTWCLGCLNSGILLATKQAIVNLVNQKQVKRKNLVSVCGIGCGAKIYDYLEINGFYSLHGRVLPTCLGIKTANPHLTVLGFAGDGGTYAEGMSHLIHVIRHNPDLTMIVFNNQVFALTTGQATPTTEKGFRSPAAPLGVKDSSLNPIAITLAAGATFVARASSLDVAGLTQIIESAIKHPGFSFIDVLQTCLSFHNDIAYLQSHSYKLESKGKKRDDYFWAMKKAKEWNYNREDKAKIPIGIFYQVREKTWEEKWPQLKKPWYQVKRKTQK
jgi:2-oxoglutarate ferredoxin oxidoreductase subunit beta